MAGPSVDREWSSELLDERPLLARFVPPFLRKSHAEDGKEVSELRSPWRYVPVLPCNLNWVSCFVHVFLQTWHSQLYLKIYVAAHGVLGDPQITTKVFRNSNHHPPQDGAPTIVINGVIKVAFLLMGLPGVISPLYIELWAPTHRLVGAHLKNPSNFKLQDPSKRLRPGLFFRFCHHHMTIKKDLMLPGIGLGFFGFRTVLHLG